MWGLPPVTYWAYIVVAITLVAACLWAYFTGKMERNNNQDGEL
jgi:hypothetical protein